jgi:hypothetical protein
MRLNIFVLLFPFILAPVLSAAQEKTTVVQVADSTTKQGFFYRLNRELTPNAEQFNKILKIKMVLAVIVVFAAILVAFLEDREMEKGGFYKNNNK